MQHKVMEPDWRLQLCLCSWTGGF